MLYKLQPSCLFSDEWIDINWLYARFGSGEIPFPIDPKLSQVFALQNEPVVDGLCSQHLGVNALSLILITFQRYINPT